MNDSWTAFSTLAQEAPQAGTAPATPAQPVNAVGVPGASPAAPGATGTTGTSQPLPAPSTSGGLGSMFWLFPVLILAMILMTTLTGKKDKKKRAELMASLKKHDKVQMIGGEIGIVAELTDDEVVVRFEEGRIRFARSAVQTILSTKSKPEAASLAEVKGEPKTTSV
jgi:preprotein translocase YajC subunit